MKTCIFLICLLGCFNHQIYAQQSPVSSGGDAKSASGSFSFSYGQISYTEIETNSISICQGVQQAFEIYDLGFSLGSNTNLKLSVFPNPFSSYVNLKIDNLDRSTLESSVFDAAGRLLSTQKIKQRETKINIDFLPSAVYFIVITDAGKMIKSFKVVKK
jgi:hypothetical protein